MLAGGRTFLTDSVRRQGKTISRRLTHAAGAESGLTNLCAILIRWLGVKSSTIRGVGQRKR